MFQYSAKRKKSQKFSIWHFRIFMMKNNENQKLIFAVKVLLKSKMFGATYQHLKQHLIRKFSTQSRREGTITMNAL